MNKKMRRVAIYEYKKVEGKTYCERVHIDYGMFHQWGVDYEEFETGPANFSTAIIEMHDGTVKNIPVELITFSA